MRYLVFGISFWSLCAGSGGAHAAAAYAELRRQPGGNTLPSPCPGRQRQLRHRHAARHCGWGRFWLHWQSPKRAGVPLHHDGAIAQSGGGGGGGGKRGGVCTQDAFHAYIGLFPLIWQLQGAHLPCPAQSSSLRAQKHRFHHSDSFQPHLAGFYLSPARPCIHIRPRTHIVRWDKDTVSGCQVQMHML